MRGLATEQGRTNDAPPGQLGELIAVSVLDDVEDIIVQSARRECVAKGEQCVHAIGSLVNLIGGGDVLFSRYPPQLIGEQRTWSYW